jgi:hypothetical protein
MDSTLLCFVLRKKGVDSILYLGDEVKPLTSSIFDLIVAHVKLVKLLSDLGSYNRALSNLQELDKNCLPPLRKAYCQSVNVLLRKEVRTALWLSLSCGRQRQ